MKRERWGSEEERKLWRERKETKENKMSFCGQSNLCEGKRVGAQENQPQARVQGPSISALWTETPESLALILPLTKLVTLGRSFPCLGLSFLALKWGYSHLPPRGIAQEMGQSNYQLKPAGELQSVLMPEPNLQVFLFNSFERVPGH